MLLWVSPSLAIFRKWSFIHEAVDVMVLLKFRLSVFQFALLEIGSNMSDLNISKLCVQFLLVYLNEEIKRFSYLYN